MLSNTIYLLTFALNITIMFSYIIIIYYYCNSELGKSYLIWFIISTSRKNNVLFLLLMLIMHISSSFNFIISWVPFSIEVLWNVRWKIFFQLKNKRAQGFNFCACTLQMGLLLIIQTALSLILIIQFLTKMQFVVHLECWSWWELLNGQLLLAYEIRQIYSK